MSKKLVYPATFVQDGDFIVVEFPDIEGAFTQGEDLQQAYEMAEEVLGSILSETNEYPPASSIDKVSSLYPGKSFGLVEVDLDAFRRKYRSNKVRRNISLPEWLNELASDTKINVSEVTEKALKEKLNV